MDVVVTGSSGLIGTALVAALRDAGHRPVLMVRRHASGDEISWDPAAGTIDAASLEGMGAVVNLAGAGIGDKRWTPERKREIRETRVKSTALLSETLAGLDRRPGVLLSGSAIGFYGDRGDEVLDETSAPGTGFLAEVVRDWEAATGLAEQAGVRVAHLRTGIVLSTRGGAMKRLLPLFKLGLGGRFGKGRQYQSWIMIEDEVRAIVHLLDADVRGPVNLTAPTPVTNKELTDTLARVLQRPALFPVPKFAPSIAVGGELAESLLFTGQRVVPGVLEASGFEFRFPELEGALRHLLEKRSDSAP